MAARVRRVARRSARVKNHVSRKVPVLVVAMVLAVAGIAGFWRVGEEFKRDDSRRTTWVINSRPLMVFSLGQTNEEMLVITIPENTMVPVSGGYGWYPAASIWALARQEGQGVGLITRSFRELVGIPIDTAVDVAGEVLGEEKDKEELINRCQQIARECLVGKKDCGDTSKLQFLKVWLAMRKVSAGNVAYLPLENLPGAKTEHLPDGSLVLGVDIDGIDLFISRYTTEEAIKNEALAIGVYNAAGYPGLATRAARIITNLGGRVLVVEDWDEIENKCEIRSTEEVRKSATYRLVKDVFGCREGEVEGEDEVDLTLLVGEDYVGEL